MHGHRIDKEVLQLDLGVVFRDVNHGLAPETGGFQNIGFINGSDLLAPRHGEVKTLDGDAPDFGFAITAFVIGAPIIAAFIAEINPARQFAHDNEIHAFQPLAFQRRAVNQGRIRFAGSDIGVEVQVFSQRQKRAKFRTVRAFQMVPFRPAHSTQQDCACPFAAFKALIGKRFQSRINRGSAN